MLPPQIPSFLPHPDDFRDAFCVAGGALGRPWLMGLVEGTVGKFPPSTLYGTKCAGVNMIPRRGCRVWQEWRQRQIASVLPRDLAHCRPKTQCPARRQTETDGPLRQTATPSSLRQHTHFTNYANVCKFMNVCSARYL